MYSEMQRTSTTTTTIFRHVIWAYSDDATCPAKGVSLALEATTAKRRAEELRAKTAVHTLLCSSADVLLQPIIAR